MNFPSLKIGDLVANLPIVQGGMGVGISLSRLASAVANEGGIGVIAGAMIGMNEPDIAKNPLEANLRALRREIQKAREMTQGILGVNLMVALTNFKDMVKTSLNEGIDIIFSGAGLPLDLPKYREEGMKTKLAPIVSSARAASIICRKWMSRFGIVPDALVVEGPKAGGHLGFKPEEIDDPNFTLERLVPEVVEAVKPFAEKAGREIPVIAAGGVFTGSDICEMLKLGASGVQMGTRFVATHECDADQAFKQAYVDSKEEDLVVIKSPVGMPGRAIDNAFLEGVRQGGKEPMACPFHCLASCDPEKSPYCIASALLNAKKGNLNKGFAFAGQNAFRITSITSVHELIETLKEEFGRACAGWKPVLA
ncbi:MAG: nitronate monooxygenase [Deltaproteobacteria bacterium]|nr:nitronate monooxygenase [Deltaproteobacteria bacterium]